MFKVRCSYCNKELIRENSKRNRKVKTPFCNHKCQGEYQRGKNNPMWISGLIKKECSVCEKEYLVKQGRSDRAKTCSKKCHGQLLILRAKEIRNCLVCGEEFIVTKALIKRFCSRECSSLDHGINMIGKGNPNYVNGEGERRHPVEFNNRLKRKIRLRDNYTCQVCNNSDELGKSLDVHHIDYDKSNNEESNLISLCNVCHSRTNGSREYWKDVLSNLLSVN